MKRKTEDNFNKDIFLKKNMAYTHIHSSDYKMDRE